MAFEALDLINVFRPVVRWHIIAKCTDDDDANQDTGSFATGWRSYTFNILYMALGSELKCFVLLHADVVRFCNCI